MLHAIEGPTLRGRILDRNGVVLAESTKEKMRIYPLKALAAHMIGYTRQHDEKHAQFYGGAGLEKRHDTALTAGKDVSLTFDARIQALTTQAMKEGGVERGAAVVLDPRTGEILAVVSLPSFDPNVFIPSVTQEDWDHYLKDKDLPLMNRAVKGFVPGAAYLPLTALAGIAAGVGDRKFTCEGKVIYGNKAMPCWIQRQNEGQHGELDMSSGFVASCNCFWYQFGNAAGIDQIEAMGHKIGFGTKYGISDDEQAGIVPSPTWLKQHRPDESWSEGYTATTSIGSGLPHATPLQLAVLAATVGNGGKVPQPSLLKQTGATVWRADLAREGLPVAQLESLRDAMRLVVDQGTGQKARSDHIVIAGQTGTAQNWRIVNGKKVDDNHVWFIGFAPYDKPTLALAILKQGGKSGGSDCAPIAKRIVEETLALPADGSGEVKPVEEVLPVENDSAKAHEKLKKMQAQFDAQDEELKREIGVILQPLGEGLELKKVTIEGGCLTILGEARDISQALGFKGILPKIGKQWEIEWTFPVPRTLKGRKRVEFRAEGVCKAAVDEQPPQEPTPLKGKTTSAADPDIIMDPQFARSWKLLQQKGHLADLPAKAVLTSKFGSGLLRVAPFQFTAPREAAQQWLANSLGDGMRTYYDKQQPWPEKPGAFDYTYEGFGDCMIHIQTLGAETVEVRLWFKFKKSLLIAPDEATPPAPKTVAPEELSGVASGGIHPTISLEEALRPKFLWPPPDQICLQTSAPHSYAPGMALPAPLQHLAEGLSAESEEALLRSSQSSNRRQQALLVTAPLK
jgi:cell division protein FtsI/penicillin-binding protein 2